MAYDFGTKQIIEKLSIKLTSRTSYCKNKNCQQRNYNKQNPLDVTLRLF